MPVLFAGLLDFDKASGALDNIAKNMGITATILGLDTAINAPSALGRPDTLLYVSKDDLSDDNRRRLTQDLVRQHLGQVFNQAENFSYYTGLASRCLHKQCDQGIE